MGTFWSLIRIPGGAFYDDKLVALTTPLFTIGDFVDRGHHSVETFLLLLALKVRRLAPFDYLRS